jgi:hypothetical protein
MSKKLDQLKEYLVEGVQDIAAYGEHHEWSSAMADSLIQAAQDEVWELIEKVLKAYKPEEEDGPELSFFRGLGATDKSEFEVLLHGCYIVFGSTAREAILAAARELSLEVKE